MKLFIAALLIISCLGKLEYVSELARHGARSPGKVYNFTKDPKDNFDTPMQLSPIGLRQHYLIGHEFRYRYIEQEKFISSEYDRTEISFKSTDYERTLDSALSQMIGIFPPKVCQQTLNSWQQKHALPPMYIEDAEEVIRKLKKKALPECFNLLPMVSEKKSFAFDLEIADVNCPPYSEVKSELEKSDTYKQMFLAVNDPIKARFEQFLSRDVEYDEIWDLCEYLTLADLHKLDLIFDYTQDDVEQCKKVHDVKYYIMSWGDERLWKYSAKAYLDHQILSMDTIIAGNQTYKAELNFGHDNSLSYILNGLGYLTKTTPELAATLFIELHSENGKHFVRTLYNDEPITFGLCKKTDCPYETFKKNVLERVAPGTIEEACGVQPSIFELQKEVTKEPYKRISQLLNKV